MLLCRIVGRVGFDSKDVDRMGNLTVVILVGISWIRPNFEFVFDSIVPPSLALQGRVYRRSWSVARPSEK